MQGREGRGRAGLPQDQERDRHPQPVVLQPRLQHAEARKVGREVGKSWVHMSTKLGCSWIALQSKLLKGLFKLKVVSCIHISYTDAGNCGRYNTLLDLFVSSAK